MHRKLHRKGGKLCLCGAGGDVDKVLRTSRLNEYFRTAANVQDAQTAVA
jgi:anti-anti-sigma regulatory factor